MTGRLRPARWIALAACNIGGQAVIEGVMMRSPGGYAVAMRKTDGSITVHKEPLILLSEKRRWFQWPLVRGVITLISALYLGVKTLHLSAEEFGADLEAAEKAKKGETPAPGGKVSSPLSTWQATLTLAASFGLAMALFVALPHAIAWFIGSRGPIGFDETSLAFHAVDGLIKAAIFVLYLWGIGRLKDIQRVFEYHGAEHKAIHAFEKGLDLTVEHAAAQSRLHPRCGTSFLFFVLLVSILLFAVFFPLVLPLEGWSRLGRNLAYVAIKIPLSFPVAAVAYECIRQSAKRPGHPLVRLAIGPGLALQRLTTREPDVGQLEVAIRAARETLAYETHPVVAAACPAPSLASAA